MKLKDNEYECALCKNIYKKKVTDEEAEKELKEQFGPNATIEDSEIVCDDCYNAMFN